MQQVTTTELVCNNSDSEEFSGHLILPNFLFKIKYATVMLFASQQDMETHTHIYKPYIHVIVLCIYRTKD